MKPEANEYSEFYSGYISLVDTDNIIRLLEEQLTELEFILKNISDDDSLFRYTNGKWSIKELIGHMLDTERIMAYRALCIARKEKKSLPGFEQDDYVLYGNFDSRNWSEMIDEYSLQRRANLLLFKSFNNEVLLTKGIANENKVSVRALIYIIAGHEKHHFNILKERYLPGIK